MAAPVTVGVARLAAVVRSGDVLAGVVTSAFVAVRVAMVAVRAFPVVVAGAVVASWCRIAHEI
jgi:hypothetical protein